MKLVPVAALSYLGLASSTSISDAGRWYFQAGISQLENHGCHCSRIFARGGATFKSAPFDTVDELCQNWKSARNCAEHSDCCAYFSNDYDLSALTNSDCDMQENTCGRKVCSIDAHFAALIQAQIDYGWTPQASNSCNFDPQAPRDKSEFSCCLNSSFAPFYYRHADQSCIDGEVTEEVSRTSVDDVATIATKLSQIDNLSFEVTADWTGPVPDSGDLSELNGSKNVDANETPVGPTPQRRRRAVLPTNFDARTEATCGTLAGITRNQGGCGSCYAFSLAKTVTHSLCKATNGGSQKMLSTMDFLNCYEPLYGDKNDACRGGYTMRGLTHFKQNGVVTGTDVNDQYGHGLGCYPYGMGGNALAHFDFTKPMKPTCPTACHGDYSTPSFSADKSGGAATIEIVYLNDDQSIMEHIYEHGAVSATYTVYEDFFAYRSGVYTKNSNVRKGGHAVAVIGWGVENGMPYWLCQNSWGPNWGWGGLFKIRRGTNEADFGARAFGGVKWNCPAGQSVSSDGKCVQGVCSDTMYSEGGVCKPCPFGGKSNAARTGCELRSVNSNTFVRIKMINNSGKTATFRWIDYDGKNHGTGPVIASGSSFTTGTTYMTHPWLIIVDGVEIFAAAPPAGSDPDVTLVLTRELKAAYVNGQVGSCKSSSSQQGLGTVTLQFVNGVNQHVEVYWISTNGSLHKYADLSPGQHYDQGTFVKHQWAAKIKNGDWIWYGTATVEDFLKYNKRVRVNLLSNKQAVKSTF